MVEPSLRGGSDYGKEIILIARKHISIKEPAILIKSVPPKIMRAVFSLKIRKISSENFIRCNGRESQRIVATGQFMRVELWKAKPFNV